MFARRGSFEKQIKIRKAAARTVAKDFLKGRKRETTCSCLPRAQDGITSTVRSVESEPRGSHHSAGQKCV
ncbi:hypothetical protein SRHO_G00146940 [Serrasalmus rhombeus]